jgi:arylsulfatase
VPITLNASFESYALGKGVLCRGCAILAALAIMNALMPRSMGAMPSARPNIVIIFCDDLGYGDLGAYGAKGYGTPNLDRMAAEGVRFTRFYVAQAVCSASRAALLTGCYPNRIGIKGALGPRSKVGIHASEVTLAELVKQRDYATAIFGKWHLGDAPQFLPTRHGFDEYLGLPYSNDMWPLHPGYLHLPPDQRKRQGYPDLPLIEGERVAISPVTSVEQNMLTTWYTDRAVQFIERNRNHPFFLYVAHSMTHVPLHVSEKFRGKTQRGLFGDVVEEIDWSVGEILNALKANGMDDRTLVIFTSDNGPWLNYGDHAGSAGPLREGKGTSWEGGIREPFIARWPGLIPAGKIVTEPAMTIDLFPTIARLVDAKLPQHKIDGMNIWPLLIGADKAKNPHDAYFIYYADNELQAVIDGPWKLSLPHTYRTLNGRRGGHDGQPVPYDERRLSQLELYNVDTDVGETMDIAAAHPDKVRRLLELAEQARDDLGDSLVGRKGKGTREPGRLADSQ